MSDKKYNGWLNYATWRVFTDTLIDIEWEHKVTANNLQEIVEDIVFSQYEMKNGSFLVEDYARVFIESVDFEEIAENINFDIK